MLKVLLNRLVSGLRRRKMFAMGNAIAIGLRKGLVDADVPVAYDTELTGLDARGRPGRRRRGHAATARARRSAPAAA